MKINPASPVVLSIAGFDPSSGAGCTADLKTFAAHGVYGTTCPTALTVQSTQGVLRSEPVSAALIGDTLDCLLADLPLAGVKIGMLGSTEALVAVAGWLGRARLLGPVVLDPVLRSSSGYPLLPPEALPAFKQVLLPLVSVVTPNGPEAELLTGLADAEEAAEALALDTPAVVVTGGHGPDPSEVRDLLWTPQGPAWFTGPRIETASTHGTGCAFSSSLLANLVLGLVLPEAVAEAGRYVRQALEAAYPLGQGRGPMHHLFNFSATAGNPAPRNPSE